MSGRLMPPWAESDDDVRWEVGTYRLPMNRRRVALAILAALAAVGVAWLTFVVWVVAGISYNMDAGEQTPLLGGWGVLAMGAAVTVGLAWACRHFWRSARRPATSPR